MREAGADESHVENEKGGSEAEEVESVFDPDAESLARVELVAVATFPIVPAAGL